MLEYDSYGTSGQPPRPRRLNPSERRANHPVRAKVKAEWSHLYPGVAPNEWYQVVQEGEYKDDMEGLWIQVTDWVTYVLAKHFELDTRSSLH